MALSTYATAARTAAQASTVYSAAYIADHLIDDALERKVETQRVVFATREQRTVVVHHLVVELHRQSLLSLSKMNWENSPSPKYR